MNDISAVRHMTAPNSERRKKGRNIYRSQDMSAEFIFHHVLPNCVTYRDFVDTGTPYIFVLKPENARLRRTIKRLFGIRIPAKELTDRQIHDIALKYTGNRARSEFRKKDWPAWNEAKRRGIMKKVTSHMRREYRRWCHDSILEAARHCSSLKEFRARYGGALEAARNLGIVDEVHLILAPALERIEIGDLFERASRFSSRREFHQGDNAAYQAAVKRSHINDIFDLYYRRDRDQVFAEAALCDGALAFYRHRDAWRSADEGGYLAEVLAFLLPGTDEIFAAAEECSGREDFRVSKRRFHRAAEELGILAEVYDIWPEARASWTYENTKAEAAKYDRYRDFQLQAPSAWWRAYGEGWLPEIAAHMSRDRFAKKWPEDELYRRASLYRTRLEFRTHDLNAYVAAYNQNLLHLIWDPRDKRTNPDLQGQTWIYRFTLGCYVYIGITNDLSKRISAHRESDASHPRIRRLAAEGRIDILDPSKGVDTWLPLDEARGPKKDELSVARYVALTLEADLVPDYALRDDLRVCNRHLNPTYDHANKSWLWEEDEIEDRIAA